MTEIAELTYQGNSVIRRDVVHRFISTFHGNHSLTTDLLA